MYITLILATLLFLPPVAGNEATEVDCTFQFEFKVVKNISEDNVQWMGWEYSVKNACNLRFD